MNRKTREIIKRLNKRRIKALKGDTPYHNRIAVNCYKSVETNFYIAGIRMYMLYSYSEITCMSEFINQLLLIDGAIYAIDRMYKT